MFFFQETEEQDGSVESKDAVPEIQVQTAPSPVSAPSSRGGTMKMEFCCVCGELVFLAQRLLVEGKLMHRTCFKCARCSSQLNLASYYNTESGLYCCEVCPDEEMSPAPQDLSSMHTSVTGSESIVSNESSDSSEDEEEMEKKPLPIKPRTVFLNSTLMENQHSKEEEGLAPPVQGNEPCQENVSEIAGKEEAVEVIPDQGIVTETGKELEEKQQPNEMSKEQTDVEHTKEKEINLEQELIEKNEASSKKEESEEEKQMMNKEEKELVKEEEYREENELEKEEEYKEDKDLVKEKEYREEEKELVREKEYEDNANEEEPSIEPKEAHDDSKEESETEYPDELNPFGDEVELESVSKGEKPSDKDSPEVTKEENLAEINDAAMSSNNLTDVGKLATLPAHLSRPKQEIVSSKSHTIQKKLIKANLNPFESDESAEEEDELVEEKTPAAPHDQSSSSLNPFWSDGEEPSDNEQNTTKKPAKVKPPRPPPPSVSRER